MLQSKILRNVLIIGAHQSYVRANAGGYVRLREFIKHLPSDISCKVIDIIPSIYADILVREQIIEINLPQYVRVLIDKVFVLGALSERLLTAIYTYRKALKLVMTKGVEVIYVPIGELLHLYLPALLIKKRFPHIKVVVDILNFEYIQDSFMKLMKRFLILNNSHFVAFCLAFVHYFSFLLTKWTINGADYVFTVSPHLVGEIKRIYFKNTIGFTPSGVNESQINPTVLSREKEYLCIYFGRVTEQKGVFNLLNVWEKLVTVKPTAKLCIAGIIDKDTQIRVIRKMKEMDLEKNIDILGEIPEEKKVELFTKSEIFLHLANCEPLFPVIGVLEGMTCGLPCVHYAIPAILDKTILDEGIYIVPNGDIQSVVNRIIRFAQMTNLEKTAISLKMIRFSKQFNWGEIAQKEWLVIKNI